MGQAARIGNMLCHAWRGQSVACTRSISCTGAGTLVGQMTGTVGLSPDLLSIPAGSCTRQRRIRVTDLHGRLLWVNSQLRSLISDNRRNGYLSGRRASHSTSRRALWRRFQDVYLVLALFTIDPATAVGRSENLPTAMPDSPSTPPTACSMPPRAGHSIKVGRS